MPSAVLIFTAAVSFPFRSPVNFSAEIMALSPSVVFSIYSVISGTCLFLTPSIYDTADAPRPIYSSFRIIEVMRAFETFFGEVRYLVMLEAVPGKIFHHEGIHPRRMIFIGDRKSVV